MIHIFDNYYIQASEMSFTLMRKGIVESGKEKGKDKFTPMGYYGCLESALSALAKKAPAREMEGQELTLKEAIEVIRECTNRISKATR